MFGFSGICLQNLNLKLKFEVKRQNFLIKLKFIRTG